MVNMAARLIRHGAITKPQKEETKVKKDDAPEWDLNTQIARLKEKALEDLEATKKKNKVYEKLPDQPEWKACEDCEDVPDFIICQACLKGMPD